MDSRLRGNDTRRGKLLRLTPHTNSDPQCKSSNQGGGCNVVDSNNTKTGDGVCSDNRQTGDDGSQPLGTNL